MSNSECPCAGRCLWHYTGWYHDLVENQVYLTEIVERLSQKLFELECQADASVYDERKVWALRYDVDKLNALAARAQQRRQQLRHRKRVALTDRND